MDRARGGVAAQSLKPSLVGSGDGECIARGGSAISGSRELRRKAILQGPWRQIATAGAAPRAWDKDCERPRVINHKFS